MAEQRLRGFRRAQIDFGETLQQFAARELGDASLWTELAAINKLAPPYVSASGGPKVARYGDTLIVPDGSREIAPDAKTAEEVFGADAALERGLLTADETGDIALLAGRANLKQALEHRVRTAPGELIFHQDYGCEVHRLRGQAVDHLNALLARAYVSKALRQDDRVDSVSSLESEAVGDTIHVDATAETITGHPVDLEYRI